MYDDDYKEGDRYNLVSNVRSYAGFPAIPNPFAGVYSWARDNGPYMLIAGIVMQLIFGRHSKGGSVTGPIIILTSWGLIISGAFFTISNFNLTKIPFPNLGAGIRKLAGPAAANYSSAFNTNINSIMTSKPLVPPVIKTTTQNGSIDPAKDSNHVFSVIGDAY